MKWIKSGTHYWVRLNRGEEVLEGLSAFLDEAGIYSGSITGIGALSNVVLGYFDAVSQQYLRKSFPEDAELLSFQGNVTRVDRKPFIHAHAIISGSDFVARGGHFFKGVVAVTMECQVLPGENPIDRATDQGTGLKLMDF